MSSKTNSNLTSRKLVIWPEGADLAPIKEAVLALGLPFKVAPFWFDVQASGEDRVLVVAEDYPWGLVTNYIHPKNPARLPDAIAWCLGMKELERGPRKYIDKMREIFGGSVIEIWEPDQAKSEEVGSWPN